MSKVLVHIDQVSAAYKDTLVLKEVSLDIFENDFLGIIGPNGGGKTTLLKVILGLLKPRSGQVLFLDDNVRRKIGYMPQTNAIDHKFPITVAEVIGSGLMREPLAKALKKEKVQQVIDQMGLKDVAANPIGELSGGQLQRTLLGRAVINDPLLLILDEPNSYVDKRFESVFYELLQEINKATAIVLVSHDIGTVLSNVKNIACVDETLHYHPGSDVNSQWLEARLGCPFDLVGHGDIPHRILKKH